MGIGIPGLYDPVAGTTRFLVNIPGAWAGKPVAGPVGAALGLPAALINDARAFGVAELRLGAGRGVSTMIGFTLGTGVGGVIAVNGHVYQGHDGTGGEMGHQTIDPDGPWCNCGNRGCLEAFARADQVAAICGTATAEEAIERARAGDPGRSTGFAQIGRYLGIGIASMIVVITPDRVVHRWRGGRGRRPDAARDPRGAAAARPHDVARPGDGRHRGARDVGGRDRRGDPWRAHGARGSVDGRPGNASRTPAPTA